MSTDSTRSRQAREERFAVIDACVARVRPLFFVPTSEDWRRSFAWARSVEGRRNSVCVQWRAKILAVNIGKDESGTIIQKE